ncbi:unnamed protein product [Brassica oleracea var. botrytis]
MFDMLLDVVRTRSMNPAANKDNNLAKIHQQNTRIRGSGSVWKRRNEIF